MKKTTSIMSCIALLASLTLCACSADKENSGSVSDSSESSQTSQSSDVSDVSEPDDTSGIQSEDTSSLPDADSDEIIERLLSEGWLGITSTGITEGSPVWTLSRTSAENITTTYELQFTTEDAATDSGAVTIAVNSADTVSTFNGQWSVVCENERPSIFTITVTDDSGNVISDSFSVMISLSGEQLVIFNGEGGGLLPFMAENEPYSALTLKTE